MGTYYTEKVAKDTNNREMLLRENLVMQAKYLIEIKTPKRATITDFDTDKIVGTITFEKGGQNVFNWSKGVHNPKKVLKAIDMLVKKSNN